MSSVYLLAVIGVVLVSHISPSSSVGGLEPAKVDEERVIRAAQFATAEIDKKSNALYASKLTKIVKAQKQVVEGMNYYLTIEVTQTQCKKTNGPVKNLDSCKIADSPKKQICKVVVNERIWLNDIKLVDDSCGKA